MVKMNQESLFEKVLRSAFFEFMDPSGFNVA